MIKTIAGKYHDETVQFQYRNKSDVGCRFTFTPSHWLRWQWR